MIPLVDLKAQYRRIKPEIDDAIARVLNDTQFILGREVESFEAEFAAYCGTRDAVGTSSGTSAIHLALMAAGIGAGDEVITVPYTFVASVAAIRHAGATPVLVDVHPRSLTMDPDKIAAAITPRTRAVMPVHLYGQCADMEPILDVARRHRLLVIEDAAQAHGATWGGRRAGSLGDLGCFSFYPGKNLGAYGEGGAVLTNDPEYSRMVRLLRDHGSSSKYEHVLVGYNARLEGLQAAVLRVKLPHLDRWNSERRERVAEYRRRLADARVELLEEMAYGRAVHHVLPVFTLRRDALREHLSTRGVATGIHYPIPVHMQKAHADLGYKPGDFPVSEAASRRTLSLPLYPELPFEDIARIADCVGELS